MPLLSYVSFSSTNDIQRNLTRLFTVDCNHLPHAEIIKKIANKLVINTNGQTIFYDDLCNCDNEDEKIATKNGDWVTISQAKETPDDLIHNVPLAEVLFDIYVNQNNPYPFHFALPKTAAKHVSCAPFITPCGCLTERNVKKSNSYRNFALESLIWLRFSQYEENCYEDSKLPEEIDEIAQSVKTNITNQEDQIVKLNKLKVNLQQSLNVPAEIARMTEEELNQKQKENMPSSGDLARQLGFAAILTATMIAAAACVGVASLFAAPLILLGPGGMAGLAALGLLGPMVVFGLGMAAGLALIRPIDQKQKVMNQIKDQRLYLKESNNINREVSKAQAFKTFFEKKLGMLSSLKQKLLEPRVEKTSSPILAKLETRNEPLPIFDDEARNSLR